MASLTINLKWEKNNNNNYYYYYYLEFMYIKNERKLYISY